MVTTVDDLSHEEFMAIYTFKDKRNSWYRVLNHGSTKRMLIHQLMGHELIWQEFGYVGSDIVGCSCGNWKNSIW